MANADLVPASVQNSVVDTQLIQTNGKWTPYTSAQETLEFISINYINSFKSQLENCRIIYEAQKVWSGRHEVTTHEIQPDGSFTQKTTDDWTRFKKSMKEHFAMSDSAISSMSKIWKNYSEGGSLYSVHQKTKVLPVSQTSLYEISTVDTDSDEGKKILDKISDELVKDTSLSLTEIRSIKKNKGEDTPTKRTQSKEPTGVWSTTKLKLPANPDGLQAISKKWAEIEESLNKINSLGLISIEFDNPKTMIEERKKQEKLQAVSKTLTEWKRFIRKRAVHVLEDLPKMKITKEMKDGKELSEADNQFNQKITNFVNSSKDDDIKKQMMSLLSEWNQERQKLETKAKEQEEKFNVILGFKEHVAAQKISEQTSSNGVDENAMKDFLKSRD